MSFINTLEKPGEKPHAVCIPFPAQGHINPMLNLSKLLYSTGFHITFVNSEYNQQRLIKSQRSRSLPSFQFQTIPDGLPPSENLDVTQDIPSLLRSTSETCLTPFKELLLKLNNTVGAPPVSCIVSDGVMSFTLEAAEELGIPNVLFWTTSASGFLAYTHYITLLEKGLIPLKNSVDLTNGYLETAVDCIQSMKGIRLRDIPSFIRTTDPEDFVINFVIRETNRAKKASAIILNTFYELEQEVLDELSLIYPPVYTIGPLNNMAKVFDSEDLQLLSSSLWKEEPECLEWLDSQALKSVVYVNFGSITVMTQEQLVEFSWGLANSKHKFLWVIRPDLVRGDSKVLQDEFLEETKNRGLLASWCPQEKVLNHPSVGGFLTHSGWNSTLESISSGVPMICWPFFAEQQTNCWCCCNRWGIGMEIDSDVDRKEVEKLVNVLMVEEKGKEMKRMAMGWKEKADSVASRRTLESLINQVLLPGVRQFI
ncbi:7-deoxyloganetin glucosyltransferase [Lactuca sativa]|uniref:7-deoxyloganetin glucosyltransferase n=1 Tax=Lactuca sativa TaxID=4236 RepID=UPI000CD9DE7E|nr:7-deoxyloganetin glucosyltransferase [Lactuca sativa]